MASSSESPSSADNNTASSSESLSSDDNNTASSSESPSSGDNAMASSSESPSSDAAAIASSSESLSSADNNTASSSESLSSDDNNTASSSESPSSDDNNTASSSESLSPADNNRASSSESLSSADDDDEKRLRIQKGNPVPQISRAQKLAESWRTIKQLKSLNRKEYDEDTKFLCRVSLIAIDCTSGWCYLGCDTCQKSMYNAPRKYKCCRCGPIKRPIYWYKLNMKVKDATGTMNLMIFCEVAEELVGVSAEELVDKIKSDDEWFTLPNKIRALLGSTHTFQVFDKYRSGSFSVNSFMDDVTVPVSAASTTQCKKARAPKGSSKAAVPTPTTTQCKEEPVHEGTAQCKEEPVHEGSVNVSIPTPVTAQCKEEPVHEGSVNVAIPTTPVTAQCKEEPVHEGSVKLVISIPVTAQCKEDPVHEGRVSTAKARSKPTRLQKPNKRMRGDNQLN